MGIKSQPPNFASEHLKKAFVQVNQVISSHNDHANLVSSEIKKLEAWLQSENISVPFCEEYSMNGYSHVLYALKWEKINSDSKAFRLLYCIREYDVDAPRYSEGETRPLIEAPLPVRLEVYPYLDSFLISLAKKIVGSRSSKLIDYNDLEEDIPFN